MFDFGAINRPTLAYQNNSDTKSIRNNQAKTAQAMDISQLAGSFSPLPLWRPSATLEAMRGRKLLHAFLLAIYPILFLFGNNVGEIPFKNTIMPLAVSLIIAVLMILGLTAIFRESEKAAITTSVGLIIFFSYGHIYDLVQQFHIGGFMIGRNRFLLGGSLLLISTVMLLLFRTKRQLDGLTSVLNLFALTLVSFAVFNITVGTINAASNPTWEIEQANTSLESQKSSMPPDIYYIILDGYANSKTLETIYGYKNDEFTNHLEERGFFVASKSTSNYAMTVLSLASSLNMEYLPPRLDRSSQNTAPVKKAIKDNAVMMKLKRAGYKYIHFSSGWGVTSYNRHADIHIPKAPSNNEFLMILGQTTILGQLKMFKEPTIERPARQMILDTFSRLGAISKLPGPKFVFAHMLTPHPPYLFTADGTPVAGVDLRLGAGAEHGKKNQKRYVEQLQFINSKVKHLVDTILAESDRPPIIIIQSDHGPASIMRFEQPAPKATPKGLKERMRILNAYYLPAGDTPPVDITPVNTFRFIFNQYFDADFEILEQKNLLSTYARPYDFLDVTKEVRF